jgi:uncharacterized protein DUF695
MWLDVGLRNIQHITTKSGKLRVMSSATLEPNEVQAGTNDHWSVAEAEKNGQPFLIRFRIERPQGAAPAAFPFLLSATWSYQPNEYGLPTSEEMKLMDHFEDALASSLEESQTAHLMVVLTNSGERDWLWYAVNEDAAMSQMNKALKGHQPYPIQFSVQKDRTWKAWTQFVGGGGSQVTLLGTIISKAKRIFCR